MRQGAVKPHPLPGAAYHDLPGATREQIMFPVVKNALYQTRRSVKFDDLPTHGFHRDFCAGSRRQSAAPGPVGHHPSPATQCARSRAHAGDTPALAQETGDFQFLPQRDAFIEQSLAQGAHEPGT